MEFRLFLALTPQRALSTPLVGLFYLESLLIRNPQQQRQARSLVLLFLVNVNYVIDFNVRMTISYTPRLPGAASFATVNC